MIGNVHSLESFGTVDGPGVRMVIFLQGCPLRCQYCHNPDTWNFNGGTPWSVETLLKEYEKNKSFYKTGGITVTGGEPLCQMAFVEALFTAAKEKGIHTCLDTSGITFTEEARPDFIRLMKVTDLVLLDIKHIDDDFHSTLCGVSNKRPLAFAEFLYEQKVEVWIRHVVVPGLTDNPKDLLELGRFLGPLRNIKALDALPYHNMGEVKYQQLGIPYPLKGVPPLSAEKAAEARKLILHGMWEVRQSRRTTY